MDALRRGIHKVRKRTASALESLDPTIATKKAFLRLIEQYIGRFVSRTAGVRLAPALGGY